MLIVFYRAEIACRLLLFTNNVRPTRRCDIFCLSDFLLSASGDGVMSQKILPFLNGSVRDLYR
jgi:hypothetical protein